MRFKKVLALTTAMLLAASLSACSNNTETGDASGGKTIRVAFWKSGSSSSEALDKVFTSAKADFEKAHEGVTVEIIPVKAGEGDYATKLALMNRSESTAPDVIYEDTYRLGSDASAGFLGDITSYVDKWDEWNQYPEAIRKGVTGMDGKIYGIPVDTDTRGLWYNKKVLKDAGIAVPWEPKTWDDVLDTARTIKEKSPDVLPFNIYAGKVKAEASSMQGFEMLLYGTKDTLYDTKENKWILGSQGFKDSLGFLNTIFTEKLGPTPQNLGNTAWDQTVNSDLFPKGKVAISLDGSWVPGNWKETGNKPWPEWEETMGWTGMPTQDGSGKGVTSMSGGWAVSMGAKSKNPDLAFEYMTYAMNKDRSLEYSIANSSVACRTDVAAEKSFQESNPAIKFFASLTESTYFRPTNENYEKVSAEIQMATERIMTAQGSPEEVAKQYDDAVLKIVGDDLVIKK